VAEGIEEVSVLGGNGSTFDKNMKGQSSEELNCLWCHEEALKK
jgi:hypothetical protein